MEISPVILILILLVMAVGLQPPTNLTVKPVGSSATLSWLPQPNTTMNPLLGYNIYRGSKPGAESPTPLNPMLWNINCIYTNTNLKSVPTQCSYTDSTPPSGTSYYTVKASSNGLLSPPSNEVSFTPTPPK